MEEEEGLSLIDMIISLKEFLAEMKRKWLFIAVTVCITSGIGLIYSYIRKAEYSASSTMMLESSKDGGAMSGAMALASQFGLMSGGSSAVINEDKLLEIIKAETIIRTALLKKATIDSTTDLMANHFIDLFGYKEAWEDNDSLRGFRFPIEKEAGGLINLKGNLSEKENSVLKMFCAQISTNLLTADKSKSGIITITTKTKSELFSIYLNQYLVEALTSFYVERITEKGRANLSIVQKRVDSISIALKDAEFTLARWKDANYQLVKAQGMIEELRLRRDVEVCNSIYLEGFKQLEISKFTLLQQTPFLQIIDQPTLPLLPIGKISLLKGLIIGFIIGFFLSCLYIFARKKYADLMNEATIKNN